VATPPDTTVAGTVANQHRRQYLAVWLGRQIWPGCALRPPDLVWPCSAAARSGLAAHYARPSQA